MIGAIKVTVTHRQELQNIAQESKSQVWETKPTLFLISYVILSESLNLFRPLFFLPVK